MNEHEHQCRVIEWAHQNEVAWPALCWLHAIANAGAGAQRGQAGKMKAEGVKPGVPDLCLPVPRGTYHGLYIEMKAPGGSESPEQKMWLAGLQAMGYYAATAYGHEVAEAIIMAYIRWPTTKVISQKAWEALNGQVETLPKARCTTAATILPLRQCQLEEGHDGPCVADPAIRSL